MRESLNVHRPEHRRTLNDRLLVGHNVQLQRLLDVKQERALAKPVLVDMSVLVQRLVRAELRGVAICVAGGVGEVHVAHVCPRRLTLRADSQLPRVVNHVGCWLEHATVVEPALLAGQGQRLATDVLNVFDALVENLPGFTGSSAVTHNGRAECGASQVSVRRAMASYRNRVATLAVVVFDIDVVDNCVGSNPTVLAKVNLLIVYPVDIRRRGVLNRHRYR